MIHVPYACHFNARFEYFLPTLGGFSSRFMYGWYSRAVSNQERFIVARLRYIKRKVWYHQIWIKNYLGFIVPDLVYIVVLALNEEMLSHEFSISFAVSKVENTK